MLSITSRQTIETIHIDVQLAAREPFPVHWLVAKNIKSYLLFYTNEINVFAVRKILDIAENGPWLKKVAHHTDQV